MPPKLYELKVYKGRREVDTPSRLLETLDLADPIGVKDLLRRHLLAAAERDGAPRRDTHLYHLDIHEVHDGRPDRRVLFTFSVPVEV